MSRENVAVLRRAYEASSQGDREAFFGMFAPEIVWDLSRSSFPDAAVYHGIDGVREWFDGLDDAFEDLYYEIEEITDLGPGQVLVVTRTQGHGQFTKIGVDYRFATVWTFRGGKVVRMDRFNDRAEALEAVMQAE